MLVYLFIYFNALASKDIKTNENDFEIIYVGSQIAAHTLMETGNGPNEPNTINL